MRRLTALFVLVGAACTTPQPPPAPLPHVSPRIEMIEQGIHRPHMCALVRWGVVDSVPCWDLEWIDSLPRKRFTA